MPDEVELTAAELGYEPDGLPQEPVPGLEDDHAGATEDSVEAEPSSETPGDGGAEAPQETGGADAGAEQDSDGAGSTDAVPGDTQETPGSVETGFVFRGKHYADQKTAENEISTWEGRISASDRRANDADKKYREYWDYVQDVKQKNDNLIAEKTITPKPEEKEKPKSFAESLDWDSLAEIKKYAEAKGYDPTMVMMRTMADHWEKHLGESIDERLGGINKTLEDDKASKDWNRVEEEVFDWAAGATNPDGAVAFPELDNKSEDFSPEFVRMMYSTWNELARENPAFGITPQAVDYAYRLTKDLALSLMQEEEAKGSGTKPGPNPIQEGEELRAKRNADAEVTGSTGAHGGANPLGAPAPADGSDLLRDWEQIKNVVVDGNDLGFTP